MSTALIDSKFDSHWVQVLKLCSSEEDVKGRYFVRAQPEDLVIAV